MIGIAKKAAGRIYESAVAWTLVFTVIRAGGNLLVLPLMLHTLAPEELGFWYVFLSLAGLSSLVDMGFFATMSRVTAYLWAGAERIEKFGVETVPTTADRTFSPNYRLLADLVKTMRLYYLGLGILITLTLSIFGTIWIAHKAQHLPNTTAIVGAWLLFLPAVFVNTTSGMWHPLLSGINQVRLNQQILVWSLVANYSVTLIGLLLGAGLFAPVAGYLVMGMLSRTAAQVKFNRLSEAHLHGRSARWSRELLSTLWPTAWRTGVVTLGIYATLNASTLICTAYLGLKATASFGLSVQLASAAVWIASAFILVKLPLIAQMHALSRAREISRLVFPRLQCFWIVFITLGLAAVVFGERVLHGVLHSQTDLLPTSLLAALFVVVGLEGHHALFREIALTAHRNPFTLPVIVAGLLIIFLELILVPLVGLWGLILAPGFIQICFNNWWTVLVGLRSMGNSFGDYVLALVGLNRANVSSNR